MNHQDGEVVGGHAFEAAGLANGVGTKFFEALAGFVAQFGDAGEVEGGGDGFVFVGVHAGGGFFFALDVARVFGFDFDVGEDGGEGGVGEEFLESRGFRGGSRW